MFNKLIHTDDDAASLLMRVLLGIVFFPHGAQKLLGWFGGGGFSATMSSFTDKMGIPPVLAFLAIMAESIGALALIAGFLTRIAALGIATNMTVAIFMVHLPYGFFMNWFGNKKGEGFEYHILAITIAAVLILKGGGKWSVDRLMSKRS
ncbi:MAG: DoxX family protein [Nitrospiraceae bacterium]|nr:MAG: DoxX family protein [Nitrospiraceae bacterium]